MTQKYKSKKGILWEKADSGQKGMPKTNGEKITGSGT